MLYAPTKVALEVRAGSDGGRTIIGVFPYGAVTTLSGHGSSARREMFHQRAFGTSVADDKREIHLLAGHDYEKPLAARSNGSLSLVDSDTGLTFEARISPEIASTGYAKDLIAQIESGLVHGLSPGFMVSPDTLGQRSQTVSAEGGDGLLRTIYHADLFELSIVTRPSYSGGDVQMRSWKPTSGPVRPYNAIARYR